MDRAVSDDGPKTILVVDDDPWTRQIAMRSLKATGLRLLEACDGQAALEVAAATLGPIHLVLTDAIMPGMSGTDLADRVRRVRPETKVMFMSGYDEDVMRVRGIDRDGAIFLPKPFTPQQLGDRVRDALQQVVPAAAPQGEGEELSARITDRHRLAALCATELLDTPREESFDRLTRLAVQFLSVPVAFMSLVDEHRDFYKSMAGVGEPLASEREMRGLTFCHYTLSSGQPLVINDTTDGYEHVPTVRTLGVAAYLGVPLILDQQVIGAFCAIDFKPRTWSETDIETMRSLAAVVVDGIALRSSTRKIEAERAALSSANALLHLAKTTAESADRAKAEFLMHMSHELRTPLNSIIGFANVLARKPAAPHSNDAVYVGRIRENGARLLALVNRLLDLSEIERGGLQLRCDWIEVDDVIETACASFADQARESNVVLSRSRTNGSPDDRSSLLHTDAAKLGQILSNLLANALKFTPAGREVNLSVDRDEASGAPLAIHVTDAGVGIAPEQQSRIFDSIVRKVELEGVGTAGPGLGLYLARAIAETLGFSLSVRSIPGSGSTFTIDLRRS